MATKTKTSNFLEVTQLRSDASGVESHVPTMIDVRKVRAAYARKPTEGEGTRLTFRDGGGFVIAELFAAFREKLPTGHGLVEVKQIVDWPAPFQQVASQNEAPPLGEDDEEDMVMEQPDVEVTTPTLINPDDLRCFYPRREGSVGTRLTFSNGGFAVADTYPEVCTLVGAPAPVSNVVAMIEHQPGEQTEGNATVN